MKIGDYVRVDDYRGSYTGIVKEITPLAISVECHCCFAWRVCSPHTVRVSGVRVNSEGDWQFELFKLWCHRYGHDWMHGFERVDENSWQNKVDGHIFTVTYR